MHIMAVKKMALLKSLQGELSVEPGLTYRKKENSTVTEFENMKTCWRLKILFWRVKWESLKSAWRKVNVKKKKCIRTTVGGGGVKEVPREFWEFSYICGRNGRHRLKEKFSKQIYKCRARNKCFGKVEEYLARSIQHCEISI